MKRIYYAGIDPAAAGNEYAMTAEIFSADHGEEWNGNTLSYLENMDMADFYDFGTENDLGNVHQNFGGFDPIPGSIVGLLQCGDPVIVYWASETR